VQLHAELEQERSKSSALKQELAKYQVKIPVMDYLVQMFQGNDYFV